MTYAIIETGGKQLRVEPGRFYDIELLKNEPDETVTIEAVLLVEHNGEVTIGQPLVTGATVEGTIMRHLRGRKVIVYKMKPKKKTRKKRGHRQEITRLMINSISLNGSVFTAEDVSAVEEDEVTVAEIADELNVVIHPQAFTEPVTEGETISVEARVIEEGPTVEATTATEVAPEIPDTSAATEAAPSPEATTAPEVAPEIPDTSAAMEETPSPEATTAPEVAPEIPGTSAATEEAPSPEATTAPEVAPEVGEDRPVLSDNQNPVEVAENATEPEDKPQ